MASSAICAGVIGKCGDMLGVWMEPVMAQLMITGFGIWFPFGHLGVASRAKAAGSMSARAGVASSRIMHSWTCGGD
jgi:hypothetical protein